MLLQTQRALQLRPPLQKEAALLPLLQLVRPPKRRLLTGTQRVHLLLQAWRLPAPSRVA